MGEYECMNCNEKFHLEEPPWDGISECDECRGQLEYISFYEHLKIKGE